LAILGFVTLKVEEVADDLILAAGDCGLERERMKAPGVA